MITINLLTLADRKREEEKLRRRLESQRRASRKWQRKNNDWFREYNREWQKNNADHIRARRAAHRAKNKEKIAGYRLKANYGITVVEYLAMLETQRGLCAVCKSPPNDRWKKLHVDHDHKTGAVRELLCNRCNVAVGMVGEDIEVLSALIRYLEKHKATGSK